MTATYHNKQQIKLAQADAAELPRPLRQTEARRRTRGGCRPPPIKKNLSRLVLIACVFAQLLFVCQVNAIILFNLNFLCLSQGDDEPTTTTTTARPSEETVETIPYNHQQTHFAEPDTNNNLQKVAVGRQVIFKCVVNHLGNHKLAWFHINPRSGQQTLLALNNVTLALKDRIHVSSQSSSVFFLRIGSVQLGDQVS